MEAWKLRTFESSITEIKTSILLNSYQDCKICSNIATT